MMNNAIEELIRFLVDSDLPEGQLEIELHRRFRPETIREFVEGMFSSEGEDDGRDEE